MVGRVKSVTDPSLWEGRVARILRDLDLDVSDIDADLFTFGQLDSLTFMELCRRIESLWGVRVHIEAFDFRTVRSIRTIAHHLATTMTRLPAKASQG